MRVLVDTNVLIIGALDLAINKDSPEKKILELLVERKLKLVYSSKLLEEYCRIALKLKDKQFSSWIRYLIITLDSNFVSDNEIEQIKDNFKDKLPKEDLVHFLACVLGGVDYLISNNREFLKKAQNNSFSCMLPSQFLEELKESR